MQSLPVSRGVLNRQRPLLGSHALPSPLRTPVRRVRQLCRAQSSATYKPPSTATAENELELLRRYTGIVSDVFLEPDHPGEGGEIISGATVSARVLNEVLGAPARQWEYELAIQRAKNYDKCSTLKGSSRTACEIDKAIVNVGALLTEKVQGRVSIELDLRLANDTAGLLAKAKHILELFKEMKVPQSKLLMRLPGTWEAIQAAKQLEAEGIATHVTLIYSFVQAVAAAQAGVSVIQPNVGRLNDWYSKHPGFIRDPKGPRQDSGITSDVNPGVELVKRVYSYCQQQAPKTQVVASGIRSTAEALALVGVNYMVLNPKVLAALQSAATLQGYNDGFSAADTPDDNSRLVRLSPEAARATEFKPAEVAPVSAESFREGLGLAGRQLLEAGLLGLVQDMERLEDSFAGSVVGIE